MIGIIITGLPASGKTYYSDWLIKHLHTKGSVYHIYGDAIAHCSYNCQYTENELDMKYNVICYLIAQASKYNYEYVVIDDLFKRRKDYDRILTLFERVFVIRLYAELSVLIDRNMKRPKYHRLTSEKMKMYYQIYGNLIDDADVEIDVSLYNRNKVKKLIIKEINDRELSND